MVLNLKLIVNFGVGFNNIDIVYVCKKGIDVINIFFVFLVVIVEIVSGLVIVLLWWIVEGDYVMWMVGFDGWVLLFFWGYELVGKMLGIVGLGDIGKNVV